VSERPLHVPDDARHHERIVLVDARRNLGDDLDAVVAERRPQRLGDAAVTFWGSGGLPDVREIS
jgi:hypothetical protein